VLHNRFQSTYIHIHNHTRTHTHTHTHTHTWRRSWSSPAHSRVCACLSAPSPSLPPSVPPRFIPSYAFFPCSLPRSISPPCLTRPLSVSFALLATLPHQSATQQQVHNLPEWCVCVCVCMLLSSRTRSPRTRGGPRTHQKSGGNSKDTTCRGVQRKWWRSCRREWGMVSGTSLQPRTGRLVCKQRWCQQDRLRRQPAWGGCGVER